MNTDQSFSGTIFWRCPAYEKVTTATTAQHLPSHADLPKETKEVITIAVGTRRPILILENLPDMSQREFFAEDQEDLKLDVANFFRLSGVLFYEPHGKQITPENVFGIRKFKYIFTVVCVTTVRPKGVFEVIFSPGWCEPISEKNSSKTPVNSFFRDCTYIFL